MVGPVWDVTASGQELVQRCEERAFRTYQLEQLTTDSGFDLMSIDEYGMPFVGFMLSSYLARLKTELVAVLLC